MEAAVSQLLECPEYSVTIWQFCRCLATCFERLYLGLGDCIQRLSELAEAYPLHRLPHFWGMVQGCSFPLLYPMISLWTSNGSCLPSTGGWCNTPYPRNPCVAAKNVGHSWGTTPDICRTNISPCPGTITLESVMAILPHTSHVPCAGHIRIDFVKGWHYNSVG